MDETLEQRIARERIERQQESVKRNLIRQVASGARPTNPVRREEAQTRFKELLSPTQPASKPRAQQSSPSGKAVEFYAWKDGEVGKIKILTEGDFTAI